MLLPIARVALAGADVKDVGFDAFFTHILMHELMHGLGPHNLKTGTVRAALQGLGLEIVETGLIDVPWWPGFPELPDLVRGWLGRPAAASPLRQTPVPPASAGSSA